MPLNLAGASGAGLELKSTAQVGRNILLPPAGALQLLLFSPEPKERLFGVGGAKILQAAGGRRSSAAACPPSHPGLLTDTGARAGSGTSSSFRCLLLFTAAPCLALAAAPQRWYFCSLRTRMGSIHVDSLTKPRAYLWECGPCLNRPGGVVLSLLGTTT